MTSLNFEYIVIILLAGFSLVRLIYYFKFKRDPELSEFDKSLWHFKFISVFFAVLMYVSILNLPSGYYRDIDLKTSSPEVVLRSLAENQEKIGEEIRQVSHVWSFLAIMTASYFVGVATFIGALQRERRKTGAKDDPKLRKPLGLV